MIRCTLCLFVKENQILLAMKKRGFGAGRWNGYGGNIKKGETVLRAAVRETREETKKGLRVKKENLQKIARFVFVFAGEPRVICHVFEVKKWEGEPLDSEEMGPHVWFDIAKLPADKMWPGDRLWIPEILAGKKLKGRIFFDEKGDAVEKCEWEETEF